jgi:S1-C subfamily serine protease
VNRLRRQLILLALAAVVVAFGVHAAFASSRAAVGNGVVVIDTSLAYQGGQATATGMVLTPSGEVLTNNHVVNGATSITAVLPSTGQRYTARVVGYDVAADVAVLQLQHVSNLKTVTISSARASIGQRVRALGNAGGSGNLVSATGTVTGLGKTITASNDEGGSERLTGLLETNANVQSGDSGGPLLDSSGRVIGMDTAASQGRFGFGYTASVTHDAYAIPIATALAIAQKIEAGQESATVHIGATAFLGVEVEAIPSYGYSRYGDVSGALIAGIVPGGPAETAGLSTGDVITAIAGKTVTTPATITKVVLAKKPGATVSVSYLDQYGDGGHVAVKLGSGPPQ